MNQEKNQTGLVTPNATCVRRKGKTDTEINQHTRGRECEKNGKWKREGRKSKREHKGLTELGSCTCYSDEERGVNTVLAAGPGEKSGLEKPVRVQGGNTGSEMPGKRKERGEMVPGAVAFGKERGGTV